MAKRARRASPSRRYAGWAPILFPEGPDGKVPDVTTLKAVFMPYDEGPAYQFFLVDGKEMGYFTMSEDLLQSLPKFSWQHRVHVVLQILLKQSKRIAVDGHVVEVVKQEDITHEAFEDLFDQWINKTWGPA